MSFTWRMTNKMIDVYMQTDNWINSTFHSIKTLYPIKLHLIILLVCFGYIIRFIELLIFLYSSGLFHWHWCIHIVHITTGVHITCIFTSWTAVKCTLFPIDLVLNIPHHPIARFIIMKDMDKIHWYLTRKCESCTLLLCYTGCSNKWNFSYQLWEDILINQF